MSVLHDLPVSLFMQAGGSHEHSELPVSQPGDQPGGFPYSRAIADVRRLAFRFERELHENRTRWRPDSVLPDSVSPTIAPGASLVGGHDIAIHEAHELYRAALEGVLTEWVGLVERNNAVEQALS